MAQLPAITPQDAMSNGLYLSVVASNVYSPVSHDGTLVSDR